MSLPPHFPDPNADPIALLEAALIERDEVISMQWKEILAGRREIQRLMEKLSEHA